MENEWAMLSVSSCMLMNQLCTSNALDKLYSLLQWLATNTDRSGSDLYPNLGLCQIWFRYNPDISALFLCTQHFGTCSGYPHT